MKDSSLGTRLKSLEKEYESNIPYNKHIIVRIDGHKFSKYTKGFQKPFDDILSKAMENTTHDLVQRFNAVTGYTQSDEITLVIPATFIMEKSPAEFPHVNDDDICINRETGEETFVEWNEVYSDREDRTDSLSFGDDEMEFHTIYGRNQTISEHEQEQYDEFNKKYEFFNIKSVNNNQIFGGRVQKIVSLVSAYCTMQFNTHLSKLVLEFGQEVFAQRWNLSDKEEEEDWWEQRKIYGEKCGNAFFDARVYGVDSDEDAYNSIMWRVRDAEKNSRSIFAQSYCSHKSLLNKTGQEQVDFCKSETGEDWEEIPSKYKYGILVKREEFERPVEQTELDSYNRDDTVTRTRVISFTEKLTSFSDENVKIIMAKVI